MRHATLLNRLRSVVSSAEGYEIKELEQRMNNLSDESTKVGGVNNHLWIKAIQDVLFKNRRSL